MILVLEGCTEDETFEQSSEGPDERGHKSVKQRSRIITELPGHLNFCPTLRHEEQIKLKKEKKEQKAHHSLPSGGPWNSSVHLVAVFTQPAGHTLLTQGSPEPWNGPCFPDS